MAKAKIKYKPTICKHCCCTITKPKDFEGCRARSCPMIAGQALSKFFGGESFDRMFGNRGYNSSKPSRGGFWKRDRNDT